MGNPWRGDDAAGLEVARRLRGTLPRGARAAVLENDPWGLVEACRGAGAVWIVDAVRSGAAPGTLHRVDVSRAAAPEGLFCASTHHLGLAGVLEIARILDVLPAGAVIYGIEGAAFGRGRGLSPVVASAVERAADAVRGEVRQWLRSGPR